MKKIFALIAVCAMTVAANAQIVSSSSRSLVKNDFPNYSRLFVSYAPLSFSGDATKGDDNPFDNTAGGVAVGWQGGWSISKSIPLYLESGLNVQYNHWSDEETESESNSYYSYQATDKMSMTFLSLNVPLNIAYKYSLPSADGVSIVPYLGLHVRGNLLGKAKDEWSYTTTSSYSGSTSSSDEEEVDFFDDGDMDDEPANRIQIGWQIGVGLNYKALYVGIGYSAEFTEYAKKLNTGGLQLTLGINL